jgi:hypothetical protein
MTTQQKVIIQIVWGALLLIAGMGLFARIPQLMSDIEQVHVHSKDMPFKRICLYLIGLVLVGGGIRKIWTNTRSLIQNSKKNT